MATDYADFAQMLIDDMRAHDGQVTSGPMAGRPLMILTTKGAKTGEDREAIVTYTRDGARYVVAATKSGAPTNPAWYHNLVAHPEVGVEAGGEVFRAHATVTSGVERQRLWGQHAAERPEFREYPSMTTRVIPVIILDRID
jgi:deazaflavin-dependent oxidoreductase (nitroreductase family)